MRGISLVCLLALGVSSTPNQVWPQTGGQTRDVQGVSVLSRALAAGLGGSPVASIQTFSATGTITYYWAGTETTAPAKVMGTASGQFRLEAALPSGTRTLVVDKNDGSFRDTDGKITPVPHHTAINLGGLTFPLFRIAAAVQDQSTRVYYIGAETLNGIAVHHIRIHRKIAANVDSDDPPGPHAVAAGSLGLADLFIDAKTNLLVRYQDVRHPKDTIASGYPHTVDFSDYRLVSGLLVPFSIAEAIGEQRTWTLQLDAIAFDATVSDIDFRF